MPKTDADRQALDVRIAREVMGWKHPNDVKASLLGDLWESEWNKAHAWIREEQGQWIMVEGGVQGLWYMDGEDDGHLPKWQPHKNVAQALAALKTLLAKTGRQATAELSICTSPIRCRVTIQNWVSTDKIRAGFVGSSYTNSESSAVCLAIEIWLDAQRLPDEETTK